MAASPRARCERGQATPEWVALLLLMALLFLAAFARLEPLRLGIDLARALGSSLLCAVRIADTCGEGSELEAAYGAELAAAVRRHAPEVLYERGMRALPVDFRSCRSAACSDGAEEGEVWRSGSGEPATAFVRLIDCRATPPPGANCSGPRSGRTYIQYWFYYPDSATLRGVPVAGKRGQHLDDWESVQVRLGPGGEADTRASSHHGYNHGGGAANWGSDAGIGALNAVAEAVGARTPGGWGPATGILFVSGGSHAGKASGEPLRYPRYTPARRLRLIALESLPRDGTRFAISPPWEKAVWRDPEAEGTG